MKKLLSSSIIAMLASLPAFAASSLTCDASGIGATTPNARMKASWSPTVYNIEWYDDDGTLLNVQSSAQTCAYGSNLTVPNNAPTKLGYTFIGWEKEEIAIISNPLANLDTSINGTNSGYISNDGLEVSNSNDYNLTENGSWAVTFSYGTINGTANCIPERPVGFTTAASLAGTLGEQFSQGEITQEQYMAQINSAFAQYVYSSNGGGMQTDLNNLVPNTTDTTTNPELDYSECWCRVTGYTPTNGSLQNINSSKWVYMPLGGDLQCASTCVSYCTMFVSSSPFTIVRPALYGQIN